MSLAPNSPRTDAILVLLDIVEYTPQAREEGSSTTRDFDNYFAAEIAERAEKHGFQFIKSIGDAALLWGINPDGMVDFARDIFERDIIPPFGDFVIRLRMIACKAFYVFSRDDDGKVSDVHGWEAIQIFRSEKKAHLNRVLVFPGLYEGIEDYARTSGFQAEEISPIEPFKGMEKRTPSYLVRLRPPLPPGAEDMELPPEYRDTRDNLRDAVQYIPVFGELYEPIPMAKDFLDLRMERQETRGAAQIFQWSPKLLQRYMELRETCDDERDKQQPKETLDFQRLGAHELFQFLRKGIIAGMPGAGKTTILRHFAYRAFEADPRAFVIFVEARHFRVAHIEPFSEIQKESPRTIFQIFAGVFLYKERDPGKYTTVETKAVSATAEAFSNAWADARAIVLIDALDEAPTRELRSWLVQSSNLLQSEITPLNSEEASRLTLAHCRELPRRSCFLTVRIAEAKRHSFGFADMFVVNSIHQDQIRQIARERYNKGRKPGQEDSPLFKKFDQAIPNRPDIHRVAGTPLTAQLMVFFYEAYGKFALRYATYELVLLFVLDRAWKRIKARSELDRRKGANSFFKEVREKGYLANRAGLRLQFEALGYIARRMLYHRIEEASHPDESDESSGERTISRLQLEKYVDVWLLNAPKPLPGEVTRDAWIDAWLEEHVLLPAGADSVAFLHSTILEFLAASSLPLIMSSAEKKATEACQPVFEDRTRDDIEVLPILCSSSAENAQNVLGRLKPRRGRSAHSFDPTATLPFRCLVDTEAIEREHLAQFSDVDDRATEERRLDDQSEKEWAYKHLQRWVIPPSGVKTEQREKWVSERIADLKKPIPLVRTVFRERYLSHWENDGSPLAILQSKLLKVIFHQETIAKFTTPIDYFTHIEDDISHKGFDSAVEAYIASLTAYQSGEFITKINQARSRLPEYLRNIPTNESTPILLGLDLPGHPLDNNLAYYRVALPTESQLQFPNVTTYPERIIGFLGSPNLRTPGIALALGFSHDGSTAISADRSGAVQVWDVSTGRELHRFTIPQGGIQCCAIVKEGRLIATGHSDKTLRVWDAQSGHELHSLSGHSDIVTSCAVTPDGLRIVSTSDDNSIRLWDAQSGREILSFSGHSGPVTSCAITPDGLRIVSASNDKTVRLWDAQSGHELCSFSGHSSIIRSCAVTPDGLRIISTSDDKTVRVWDAQSGREIHSLSGHTSIVTSCAITPDGFRIVSASYDQTVRFWDAQSGHELRSLSGHSSIVTSCAITPDGSRIVSASNDQTVRVWDAQSGRELRSLSGHSDTITSCAVTPDGLRIVSASYDQTIRLWDAQSGRELRSLSGHSSMVRSCAVAPDGLRIASASFDHTVRLWDLQSGRELRALSGHSSMVTSCTITPDGLRIVSASRDKTVRLWDAQSGRELRSLSGHSDIVTSCAVTPDGFRIVSASNDKTVRVWDAQSGRELRSFSGHTGPVTSCAVTIHSLYIVSASHDKTVRVWDTRSGRELRSLLGHSDGVTSCAVTPDGIRIVSASYDQTVRVWELETGRELETIYVGNSVWGLAINPKDPNKVVAALSNGTCVILNIG